MPTYEYVCKGCEHPFEEWSPSMDTAARPACPKCGSRSVERQVSVFAARQGEGKSSPSPFGGGGGCGRCGDPHGPCSRD